jgi:hypothetical protein
LISYISETPFSFLLFFILLIPILFQGDSQNVPENSIGRENGSFSSQDGSSVATGPLSVAFEFVTRLASDLFARGRRHLDGSSDAMDEVESHWSNEISEIGDDIDKCNKNHVESPEHAAVIENDSSVEKSVDVVMADNPVHSECFKHFDVLQCPLDHHYLENTTQVNSHILFFMLLHLLIVSRSSFCIYIAFTMTQYISRFSQNN